MSSRGFRAVWLRVQTEKGKGFRLFLPVSLGVLRELLDSILDTAEVLCVFIPDGSGAGSRFSVRTVKDITEMLMELFGSLKDEEPYNLVDVSADGVKVSITVR